MIEAVLKVLSGTLCLLRGSLCNKTIRTCTENHRGAKSSTEVTEKYFQTFEAASFISRIYPTVGIVTIFISGSDLR